MIKGNEQKHGEIQAGDVVIFYSGYDDKYYKPFPEGNRLAWDPLVKGDVPVGRPRRLRRSSIWPRRE